MTQYILGHFPHINYSKSLSLSKNSFFKRLQIKSNASGTNSGTMWFRLLQRADIKPVRNRVTFPAGSQNGNHPTLKPLKHPRRAAFFIISQSKSNNEIQGIGDLFGYQPESRTLVTEGAITC